MTSALAPLQKFIEKHHGINSKNELAELVSRAFHLTKDRSVFYCSDFAIRFSSSGSRSFGNTVLSLSNLRKFDDRPFVVCLVTPGTNFTMLANSTFLKKVSHSSQMLRTDNIRGSFNGSDIVKEFAGLENQSSNFSRLFAIHQGVGFDGNLPRLVEATNNIVPTGTKFQVSEQMASIILDAPSRARGFLNDQAFEALREDLRNRVEKYRTQILCAAFIENVNVRGRIIEYLIAGEDKALHKQLIESISSPSEELPAFKTENALGDYHKEFERYLTETDVKTKIMVLDSNPKAYNLDKILQFLATEKSVFMFFFVGIVPGKSVQTTLVSMFQKELLSSTILLRHWAGRNSRGVSQFEGKAINELLMNQSIEVDEEGGVDFLKGVIQL